MGNRRGLWRGINLKAEDTAQKRTCQYHKEGCKEPGRYLFINSRVSHLPVMIDTHCTNNAEYGRKRKGTVQRRKES